MKKEFAPAFPVNVAYDSQGKIRGIQTGIDTGMEIGLTKREYFAAMAPTDIPDWFEHVPSKQDFPKVAEWSKIENENDRKLCQQWVHDGIFELPEHLQWFSETFQKHNDAKKQWSRKNEEARYFQWRMFYADNIIAELEK